MTEINNKKRHREESDFLHEKSGQNTTSTFPEIVVTLDKDVTPLTKKVRSETETPSVPTPDTTSTTSTTSTSSTFVVSTQQPSDSSTKSAGRIIKLNRPSSRLPPPPSSSHVPSDPTARRQHIRNLIVQETLKTHEHNLHNENEERVKKTNDQRENKHDTKDEHKNISKDRKEHTHHAGSSSERHTESKQRNRDYKSYEREEPHERRESTRDRESRRDTRDQHHHHKDESHSHKRNVSEREKTSHHMEKENETQNQRNKRSETSEHEYEKQKRTKERERKEIRESQHERITASVHQTHHSKEQSREQENDVKDKKEKREENIRDQDKKKEDVTISEPSQRESTATFTTSSELHSSGKDKELKTHRWEESPSHSLPIEQNKQEIKERANEPERPDVKIEKKFTGTIELVNSPLPTTTTTTTRHDTTPTPTLVAQSTPTRTPLHVTSTTRSGGESRLRLTHQLEGCRSVENFEKIGQIGDGAYGVVFKARDKATGEIVALKKVKMDREKEGFPITSLREIKILMQCKHKNIVDVKEIVVGKGLNDIFIVMEYCEHDLKSLMSEMKSPFTISEVKCLMIQLLSAVEYLHENWIIHRDIKTSNLLLTNSGIIKLADFGLAREYSSPVKVMTPGVVTLWYRAPELLLGQARYTTAIDMWSVGCVFGELLQNEPLFPGKSEFKQLDLMFKLLGTVNERIWPGFSELPNAKTWNFVHQPYNNLRRKFPQLSDYGFDLLNRLLTYDPDKRITAREALRHPFFEESPLPKDPEMMPTFRSKNDTSQPRIQHSSSHDNDDNHKGNSQPQIVFDIDREYEMQERTYAAPTFQLNRAPLHFASVSK